jgi:hypothetical protein
MRCGFLDCDVIDRVLRGYLACITGVSKAEKDLAPGANKFWNHTKEE